MKIRLALLTVLAISGTLLAARGLRGPLTFPLSINSPMNVEGCFALAFVTLLLTKDRHRPVPAGQGWDPALAVAVAVIVIAAFAKSLDFPFLADDYTHIWNAHHADWHAIWAHFTVPETDGFFRPAVYFSYAVDSLWAGLSPVAWRSGNLAIHVGNCLLLYWLCRELRFGRAGSFMGALVFGIHGSRPEAVTWVAARFDLMAVLFSLACLLAVLHGAKWWLTAPFLALALMSKESAYIVPFLAIILLRYFGLRWREIAKPLFPLFLVAVASLSYRLWLLRGIGGYHDSTSGAPTVFQFGFATTLKAMLPRFWAVLLFPLNWTDGLGRLTAILLAAAIVALAYLAIRVTSRQKVLLGFAVACVCSLPVHQFLSFGMDLEKSRVIYFASIGLAMLFAAIFEQLDRKVLVSAMILVAFESAALQTNLAHWRAVGELAERTCQSQAHRGPTVALGLPNVVDGVYFLHTGFPDCVHFIDPAAQVWTAPHPGARVTTWDPLTRTLH